MKENQTCSPHTLDGVLPGPLPRGRLVTSAVGLVDMRDLRDQRVVGVRVGQHRANRKQNW